MIANLLKYTALGLVLIASIVAEPGDRIPAHPNCHDPQESLPVYFVHPTNCSRFYECKGKDAWEFECPAGLHFNSKINVCDYPANAQCEGQSTVTATNPTSTTQAATTTNNPTTTESSTSAGTTTTQGTTSTTNSPTTTEGTTSAGTTTTSRPTTTESSTSAETTTDEEITITTSRPTTAEGTPSAGTTTTSSYPDTTTTSYPDSTSGTTGTTQSITDCDTAHPNYYPDGIDCTKYMGCQENCVQYFKCPEGLYWNNLQKRCDVFANSQCPCPIIPPAPNVWTGTIDRTTRIDCYEGYC